MLKLVILFVVSFIASNAFAQNSASSKEYVCLPCGNNCDTIIYKKPGTCSHCNMQLVEKPALAFKTIQPEQLCHYLDTHSDVVVLDVRTKEEYDGKTKPVYGRIKNAVNIPIQELDNRLAELEKFKNKEIIVYCSHSKRSPRASYLLMQKGFSNVTNMAGGISTWKSSVTDQSCIDK